VSIVTAGGTMPRVRIPYGLEAPDAMITDLYHACSTHLLTYKDYSPLTIRSYERTWRQFVDYVTKTAGLRDEVRSFNEDTCLGFAEELAKLGVSVNVIITKLAALSTLAKYGMQHKNPKTRKPYMATNPTAAFEWPQAVKRERKYLYPKELAAFLAVELSEPWQRNARALLVDTGLRSLELTRAKVGDLHDVNGLYYLSVVVKGRGRNRRKLDIPVSAEVVEMLHKTMVNEGRIHPDQPLLTNSRGEAMTTSSLTHLATAIAKRAGIDRFRVGAHTLRHTMEIVRRRGGIDPLLRSRMMGHANPTSIQAYDHIVPDELHAARQQQHVGLDRYLGNDFTATQGNEPRTEQLRAGEEEKVRDDGH